MRDEHPEQTPATRGFSLFDVVLLLGFLVLAFQMLGPVLTIPLHIPVNYNEGWNAIFDARAVTPGAGPLYPPSDSFVFNNYPPLGFYLVGALGRYVFGDMIVAGRIVALFSLLSAAGLIGFCVCRLGGTRRAGIAAGLLLLLFINSYYKIYVAVDDPQWLAHATMLAGLAILLRGGVGRLRKGLPDTRLVAAALLVVAGGFIKHNLVALPLAVTVWLVVLNRRAATVWMATGLAGLGAGIAAIAALHGWAAYDDILRHRRVFRPA
jgi:4-amino-4-deoxy-L-arabinose transferase-like glycosyltransferase